MIVDDNPLIRTMIRDVIANPADDVSEYEDGVAVVSAFRQINPDYVLMDLQMPRMNGIEATRKLKQEFPGAKVIIVSDFHEQEFRDEAKDAGAVSYFTKDDLTRLKLFIHE